MEELKWFTAQVQACEPAMYRLAMSILSNGDDAADAAQETICIAFLGTIVGAIIGGFIARAMFRKHFEKAGIL